MNNLIPKTIGVTDLRANTRKVLDLVRKEQIPLLVLRDSKPEAVIISYKEYERYQEEKRRLWNAKVKELTAKTRPYIVSWLKKKGYHPKKITGDRLLEILEKEDAKSGR